MDRAAVAGALVLVLGGASLRLHAGVQGAGPQQAQTATHVGSYAQADIEAGSRAYGARCVGCHGVGGDSVAGVDLRAGTFKRAATDEDLARVITQGIAGTSMPAHKLEPTEVTALVAYLRNMRDVNAGSVALGEADRGRAVFEKAQCSACHRVRGRGSRTAPDLTNVGAVRAAQALQRSLVDPSGAMLPGNRPVRAVTRDGRIINGRRLNEDTFTVQLIDEHERMISLDKATLREYTVSTTSTMPSYKDTLGDQELADLIAYLLTLKG
jgi:putative heme-binding domain-containing protein